MNTYSESRKSLKLLGVGKGGGGDGPQGKLY